MCVSVCVSANGFGIKAVADQQRSNGLFVHKWPLSPKYLGGVRVSIVWYVCSGNWDVCDRLTFSTLSQIYIYICMK